MLLVIMGACSSGPVMRNATGFAYEIVVTMDKADWDAPAGKAIKAELTSDIPGLPQAEPAFKITYVTPDQFNGLLTYVRNVLIVRIDKSQYTKVSLNYENNRWAKGQVVMTLTAPDDAAILEYVKAHIDSLGVDYRIFNNWNIHIHVPEGATPKDGPSAGITIATSIASALTQRKVRKNTAMTGEITLRGKVLPVGGIKEKILAAKRAGITDIVMCQDNRKDIEEIPEIYRKGVEFHYVENVQDVWKFALTDEKVDNPIDLSIKEEEKN